ncbi:MAG: preprotein translocase subunit SecE [Acidobacteriota bacterium]
MISIRKATQFLSEVRLELKRTTWPSWPEVRGTTVVVIITVFIFGAYFFVVDKFLNWFIHDLIIKQMFNAG